MNFFDVLFPVNIGRLTYRCPESFLKIAKPGMIVSAPLKNKIVKGVIAGKSLNIPKGDIRDIQDVCGNAPALSIKMLDLLTWMSEYYVAEQGLVLKNMLPKEAFTKVKRRSAKVKPQPSFHSGGDAGTIPDIIDVDDRHVQSLLESFHKGDYETFLLHAPSSLYEYSFLVRILAEIKSAIILVPEVSMLNNLYPLLSAGFGERVSLFHSELSRGKRSEAIERILSGQSDIVLGTRSAVFAPLEKVSLIAVIHEHSGSYKQESSPCYNARDVSVLRGYIEKSTVLLSSICPSIESLYNCRSGKYNLLKPAKDIQKPKVKVIDMRNAKLLRPYLSKAVVDASKKYLENNRKIMFVVNRRGHSTLLHCRDCNYIEECLECRIPLVFHKQDMSMKCHYCGLILTKIPEICGRCKGYNIELSGAGTQRVQEDLEDLFGTGILRLDSDRAKRKSEVDDLIGATFAEANRIIIGTKLMTRRLDRAGRFSMAAVLNTDLFLNIPDFRSPEKAYQEISSVIDKIEPDGEVFIQTRMPQNYLYKSLKNYDYNSFFREELNRRKSLGYPPYSRLLLMKFIGRKNLPTELSEKIRGTDSDLEILGPYISKNRRGENEHKILLKSAVRGKLQNTAKTLIETFKSLKDVKIKIDVDPVVI